MSLYQAIFRLGIHTIKFLLMPQKLLEFLSNKKLGQP